MRSLRTLVCLGAVLLGVSSRARAQEPDVRDIPPLVMLVVDSSGSMEDLPGCTCTSETDCTNCEPKCGLPNTFQEPPKDAAGNELKKNRWAVTLEALTGKFIDFQCTPLVRNSMNGFTGWYDEGFSVPYHQPWKCSSGGRCDYPGPQIQETNGILDNYRDTLRFGLATFDGEYTYKGGSDLIDSINFSNVLSNGMPGMWSAGDKKPFMYPGCDKEYFVNSGVRSETATEGKLIPLNSTSCALPPCDMYELNDSIQDSLLRTRPYAGTPIASSLDDLYDILMADAASDTFAECRTRYAFLITDGAPDKDFRDLRCQCGDEDKMVACDAKDPTGGIYHCPYPTAPVAAKRLIDTKVKDTKLIEKLFVLGMSVKDAEARATLKDIAQAGNTDDALMADDPNTLRSTLDNVFAPLLNPVSRSVPAFAVGLTGVQYQISTGFQVSSSSTSSAAPPWRGLIERRRFSCEGDSGELTAHDIVDKDRFHKVLADQGAINRVIQTAVPPSTIPFDSAVLSKALVKGDQTDQKCGTGCVFRRLDDVTITPAILNVSTTADRLNVLNWMSGAIGSVRENRPLGDIYHASPALVGPPKDEPADDAYTRFRARPEVRERPLMMYITTNDGILHAISVEDLYPAPKYPISKHDGDPRLPMSGGHELWGFVPPLLLKELKHQLTAHEFNLDGTPVVKDVFFKRATSAAETEYHTVLITGMRGGGHGYFALDVTDPLDHKFLWQFTDDDMGLTYGQPEIVQATFKFAAKSTETPTVQTRAVAILPGGKGTKKSATSTDAIGCSSGETSAMLKSSEPYKSFTRDPALGTGATQEKHRKAVQCWERQGRALYFVDVETGQLIKKVFDTDDIPGNGIMFPSPVVGTPTAYQDAVATVADRGYVIDADGVIWRIDMKSQDVEKDFGDKGWTVRPFHDVFWDKPAVDGGETTYERPILSLDRNRRVVVIVGTGDTDNFEKAGADNRIVSLTEVTTSSDPKLPDDYQALINWELRNEGYSGTDLVPTEMVTGSMALFEGQLFAATFIPNVGSGNACEYGRGRMWSLSYIEPNKADENFKYGGTQKAGTFSPLRIPIAAAGADVDSDANLFNVDMADARKNLLIQGLGTTQRMTCTPPDDDPAKSYFAPELASIEQTEQPAIWVVAQASKGGERAKSTLGTVQTPVERPKTFSRITSWAASID